MIGIIANSQPGSMRDLVSRKDWGDTPLGAISSWPQSLRTTLDVIHSSRFPMFLYWGKDMLCFYNDAYRPYLGSSGKHPSILGTPVEKSSPETWPVIGPYLVKVMETGDSFFMEDFAVPMFRNGVVDEWFGNLSFSPVIGDDDAPAGVLAVCFETTKKEAILKYVKDREEQLNFIIEAAELGTWDFDPATGMMKANKRLKEWFGLPDQEQVDMQLAMDCVVPEDRERVRQSVGYSISRRSGGKHDIVYTVVNAHTGVRRIVRAKGKASFRNDADIAYRFNGTLQDITDEILGRQAIKKSEAQFRELLENSPIAMGLFRGDEYRVVSINENMLALMGRNYSEVIDAPVFDVLPAETFAGLKAVLEKVRLTGECYSAFGHSFKLPRGKKILELFIDLALEPILDNNGKVNAIIVAASDVTERVMMQRKLDQKKEQIKKDTLKASIDAQEKERELISNELHDNVNQLLACTKLFLELIESDDDGTKVSVSRGSAFIEQAMEEIRDISHALNPGILNFVGLFKSIREMLEKLNRTQAIIFSFDCTRCKKEWKPNPDIELAIFRIVQKQVANIVQHSGATSADIVLSSGADFMELTITDDGRGFDMKKTRNGLGLLNIVNRAELLNGSVSLYSSPDKGCRLKIRIPAKGRRFLKRAVSR